MDSIISVIIPVYNVEDYLEECLESVINQSYKNIEVILVDDGSTDKSGEICDVWAQKDSRIKVIHKNNGGLSDARNVGISEATGNYLLFVDSDDCINKHMVQVLLHLLIKYNADISQGTYKDFYNKSEIVEDDLNEKYVVEEKSNIEALRNLHDRNLGMCRAVIWNKLYKKELFNDIRFPIGKLHEDEFVNYKLYYKARKIVNINKNVYYYRQRSGSIMNSGFDLRRLDVLDAYYERLCFFRETYKNDIVIDYALDTYCKRIIDCYYLYAKTNNAQKHILKQIVARGKKEITNYMLNKRIKIKNKFKFFMVINFSKVVYRYIKKNKIQ